MRYEYIRLEIDLGDLNDLNALSSDGWRVVASFNEDGPATVLIAEPHRAHWVLLEREMPQTDNVPGPPIIGYHKVPYAKRIKYWG